MADENKVTDEMLNAASDADDAANNGDSVTNESDNGTEDVKKDAENLDDGEDTEKLKDKLKHYQDERSGFGRRLSAMEKDAQDRNDRLESVLNRIESLTGNSRSNSATEDVDDVDDDVPITKSEIRKMLREDKESEIKETSRYSQNYLRQFNKLGRMEDPEYYDSIFKEMEKNFNNKLTGNPMVDAELNYDKAEKALLKKTLASSIRKNPLKGNKPDGALGVGGDTTTVTKGSFVLPKLDEHATAFMAYAKKNNMSEKRIEKALSGETPANLKGNKVSL